MKRLLTIGHSYVAAANRELAHQMALAGQGEWQVTAVAPAHFRGDLRPIAAEPIAEEACTLKTLPVRLDRVPHLMWYGGAARAVFEQGWDVVHCWEEPYTLAAAQAASYTSGGARLVVASFQNIVKWYPWPLSAFERATMARAAGWIAFGHTIDETLRGREGYRGKPSRIIPPGVDLQRFAPDPAGGALTRRRLGWDADASVVGFVGRFVEQKGLEVLMDALRRSQVRWHALFVGGGPLEDRLRAFAAEQAGRVHVQTGVPHDEVPAWLNAMTVLCAPSQTRPTWREQFGRMLIEAMACSVPIVASDSGEIPHVVGDAGAVVGETDVAAWTAAIDRLLADDAARAQAGARGLARAHARFAWPVVAREHLAFFEAVMAS